VKLVREEEEKMKLTHVDKEAKLAREEEEKVKLA
jgi:hypothetical protein